MLYSTKMTDLEIYRTEIENSKQIVAQFMNAIEMFDAEKLDFLLADDFVWWVKGKKEYLVRVGKYDKNYFLQFLQNVQKFFPNGISFKIALAVAENNKVLVEANFNAQLVDSTRYENNYHILFTLRGGKIKLMKEYMDTDLIRPPYTL